MSETIEDKYWRDFDKEVKELRAENAQLRKQLEEINRQWSYLIDEFNIYRNQTRKQLEEAVKDREFIKKLCSMTANQWRLLGRLAPIQDYFVERAIEAAKQQGEKEKG